MSSKPGPDHDRLTPSSIIVHGTTGRPRRGRAQQCFGQRRSQDNAVDLSEDLMSGEATRFVSELNEEFHGVPAILFPDGAVLVEPAWKELRGKLET